MRFELGWPSCRLQTCREATQKCLCGEQSGFVSGWAGGHVVQVSRCFGPLMWGGKCDPQPPPIAMYSRATFAVDRTKSASTAHWPRPLITALGQARQKLKYAKSIQYVAVHLFHCVHCCVACTVCKLEDDQCTATLQCICICTVHPSLGKQLNPSEN